MAFLLSTENAVAYLLDHALLRAEDVSSVHITSKSHKNFNLIVEVPGVQQVLLKQESLDSRGIGKGDLQREWHIHQLFQRQSFSGLANYSSTALFFDVENAILVLHYLSDYADLESRLNDRPSYSPALARQLGYTLATFHRATFDDPTAKKFLLERDRPSGIQHTAPDFARAHRSGNP